MRTIAAAFWVSLLVAACAACNDNVPSNTTPKPEAKAPDPGATTAPEPEAKAGAPAATAPADDDAFAPQVAGQFYPDDPAELRAAVRGFIDAAKADAVPQGRDVFGVLAPHAGYRYSGPIAGAAFKALEGRGYRTVVLLAPTHRQGTEKLSTMLRSAYRTPLGPVPIDRELIRRLTAEHPGELAVNERAFYGEHALEVELPFLQVALPGAAIVPFMVGTDDEELLARAGAALYEELGARRDVVFVVSSDLSHYHPAAQADALDEESLGALERFDLAAWRRAASRPAEGMCGFRPLQAFLAAFAKYETKKRSVVRLAHGNSGDATGDGASVVGYGALAFTLESGMRKADGGEAGFGPYGLAERRALMAIAKAAVAAAAKGESYDPPAPRVAELEKLGAAFVTLKKGGDLRGCIGHVIARVPLFRCVADVARSAAIHDTRFAPVTPDELKELTFEISVLTPPRPTTADQVVVGRDGLIMSRGMHSGLLLPQVPVEWGWGKEEFLMHTCRKAGLPPDCWKDPATKIESFQAIVWGEGDL